MLRMNLDNSVLLSLGLALGLCVACGGSSSDPNPGSPGAGAGGARPVSGAGAGGAATTSSAGAGGAAATSNAGAGGAKPTSGTGGAFTSSVPGDKPLNTLTSDEVAQLCKDFDAHFGPDSPAAMAAQEVGCRLTSVFLAALSGAQTDAAAQAACKSTYDACVAAPSESDPAMCSKPDASCTATVAEEAACLNDSTAALTTLKDSFPKCSELTLASLQNTTLPGDESTTPPSCAAVQAKCPSAPMPGGSGSP